MDGQRLDLGRTRYMDDDGKIDLGRTMDSSWFLDLLLKSWSCCSCFSEDDYAFLSQLSLL